MNHGQSVRQAFFPLLSSSLLLWIGIWQLLLCGDALQGKHFADAIVSHSPPPKGTDKMHTQPPRNRTLQVQSLAPGYRSPDNTSGIKMLNATMGGISKDCSSFTAMCHIYIQRMINFYEKIGGWVMLGIIAIGVTCLLVTYFHGKKQLKGGHQELTIIRRWDIQQTQRGRRAKQTWI